MSDLISRQDAIEVVQKRHMMLSKEKVLLINDLEKLPSAEPKRGKWIKKHRHYGGFRSYTGFDSMGEQHTITVDERTEYDDFYCMVHPNDSMRRMTIDEQLRRTCEGWSAEYVVIEAEGGTDA